MDRPVYRWWYDKVESRFYDVAIKCLLLPFGGEQRWRRRMIEPVHFGRGEQILEMCCGTGGATYYISEEAEPSCRIMGMDMSVGQLAHAADREYLCPTKFARGDVTETGFDDASFDKVFISHAIHEMPREDRMATLREARRVLKHTGQLIVLELDRPPGFWMRLAAGLVFLYWLPGNFETRTRRDMFRRGLTNEVAEAGFDNIEKHSVLRGLFQTVIASP